MIDTNNTASAHHSGGFFSIGSGPTKILLLGSCRVLPYVNYFNYLNQANRFTINLVNVVNFWLDEKGQQADTQSMVSKFEQSPAVRKMIAETNWFFHEHTESFGMFNTNRELAKNIYGFGMKAAVDVSLPNFHNIFILCQDIIDWNPELKSEAAKDMHRSGDVSEETLRKISDLGTMQLEHFLGICRKSGLPEFGVEFENKWRTTRFFWTINHISTAFASEILTCINNKHLHLDIPHMFWERISGEDLFANPRSPVTKYDVQMYGLKWPQAIEPLKIK